MDRKEWDKRYAGSELVWTAEPNRFLVSEVSGLTPGRALDVACGEGRNAVWLAGRGWDVTAVDFSSVGLDKGRRLAAARNVEVRWVHADVVEWSAEPAAFDLVVVLYLHLTHDDRRRAFSNAADAVAPGGALLVVGHDSSNITEGWGGPQDPAVLYTANDVARDVPDFTVVKAERVRRPVRTVDGPRIAIDVLVLMTRPA